MLDKGSEGWTEGKVTVNDTKGALGQTVGQLYSQEKVGFHQVSFLSAADQRLMLKIVSFTSLSLEKNIYS